MLLPIISRGASTTLKYLAVGHLLVRKWERSLPRTPDASLSLLPMYTTRLALSPISYEPRSTGSFLIFSRVKLDHLFIIGIIYLLFMGLGMFKVLGLGYLTIL